MQLTMDLKGCSTIKAVKIKVIKNIMQCSLLIPDQRFFLLNFGSEAASLFDIKGGTQAFPIPDEVNKRKCSFTADRAKSIEANDNQIAVKVLDPTKQHDTIMLTIDGLESFLKTVRRDQDHDKTRPDFESMNKKELIAILDSLRDGLRGCEESDGYCQWVSEKLSVDITV